MRGCLILTRSPLVRLHINGKTKNKREPLGVKLQTYFFSHEGGVNKLYVSYSPISLHSLLCEEVRNSMITSMQPKDKMNISSLGYVVPLLDSFT